MRSDISGFHRLSLEERLKKLKELAGLTDEELGLLKKAGALEMETANRMIENAIGTTGLPVGIATNFIINGRDVLVPMTIEEPSVVAAASYAAKLARPGGFVTASDDPVMIGQIQIVGAKDTEKARKKILENKEKIIELCNKKDSVLVSFGGGAKDVEVKIISTEIGKMIIVHLLVDVRDAMGANAVNTMCEAVTPLLEELAGGKARLRIISNLATRRLAHAKAVWKKEVIGEDAVNGILAAYYFAKNDIYRCATHNKGVMNGIDAVVIATGNDFRAVEAGAHAFASIGSYKPLTTYEKNKDGDLVGMIELPMAVGIVGGTTRTNPIAKIALKILGVKSAKELAEIIAAVGLAQNFAALRALSTEGIQRGHMELHAKNIAVMAGAKGSEIDKTALQMIKEKNITVSRAKEIIEKK
ncbi:MAG: hydroxymethylglutaryl-CoA reductase, degradative [Candidatus Aenigmarchaeota archaeon]|nr:hydroxymethylglutaryl-CoA reductase, degradative [Candidatus Aenigmarchaeota archaeon]